MHDDLVHRDFTAGDVNERWLTDITERPADEGKLCLCAINDIFSHRTVGYSRVKYRLAVSSLDIALIRRRDPADFIMQLNRGSQFHSGKLVRALHYHHLIGSIGQLGADGENAAMQPYFPLL